MLYFLEFLRFQKIFVNFSEDSGEVAPDLSSPSAEPVTPGTQASSEQMTNPGMKLASPSWPQHEKRIHGGGSSNEATLSHQTHRLHKAQAPH